ncbi:hypothetical protein ScPMuIL_016839 [Solemya velum]
MVGTSTLNLSLLSRGIGEISTNGHEKVDVVFEPQDYFNFAENPHRIYFPTFHPSFPLDQEQGLAARTCRELKQIDLPKTFTTRKGALLLYSEDLAQKTSNTDISFSRHRPLPDIPRSLDDLDLRTVDDLTKSILSYGNGDTEDRAGVYLKFVHSRSRRKRDFFERQIRPGFSAKRYLSSWTKSWNDDVLEKVISRGYLTERSLFYYNPLMPHMQRRLNDDMSHYPAPYKLMRSMLVSPGSLSGYTFYRIRPESGTTYAGEDDEGPPATRASIKVISTQDGVQREVTYASLDRKTQEDVLTDLLVKSAVHYAMKKQQEFLEDKLVRESNIDELSDEESTLVQEFNMQYAFENLSDIVEDSKVSVEIKSSESDSVLEKYSPFISEGFVSLTSDITNLKPHVEDTPRKEYIGNIPVIQIRDNVAPQLAPLVHEDHPVEDLPSFPVLPPINLPALTPIGEASREQTSYTLPPTGAGVPMVNVHPATPQYATSVGGTYSHDTKLDVPQEEDEPEKPSWGAPVSEEMILKKAKRDLEEQRRSSRKKTSQHSVISLDGSGEWKGPIATGGSQLHSSSESLTGGASSGSKPGRPGWKGSTHSLKSLGSKRAPGSKAGSKAGSSTGEGSVKGSVVLGPGDTVISVGGTIKPSPRVEAPLHPADMVDTSRTVRRDYMTSDESEADEPEEWKEHKKRHYSSGRRSDSLKKVAQRRESDKSQVTEKEIVDLLAEHARNVADSVLDHSAAGQDLNADAQRAADLWLERYPPNELTRSQSIQEFTDSTIFDEVMKAQHRNSAGPTAAEYRELIKDNLAIAVASSEGIDRDSIPRDVEIDQTLIKELHKTDFSPTDLEIVKDEESGKSVIRSKSQMGDAKAGVRSPVSIPGDAVTSTTTTTDMGGIGLVNYGPADTNQTSPDNARNSAGKSQVSFKDQAEAAMTSPKENNKAGSPAQQLGDAQSEKSDSRESTKKSKSPEKKKEEFVVGKPREKKPKPPPVVPKKSAEPKKPKAKGKGKAKKKDDDTSPEAEEQAAPEETQPEPSKDKTPEPESEPEPEEELPKTPVSDADDYEFTRVEEEESPSPEPIPVSKPLTPSTTTSSTADLTEDTDDEAALRQITNRDARAAKRAAQAEKRRQEVEKRRKEREEQAKREKEMQERQEQMKLEMEEARRRKEEQRRLRKQQEEEDRLRGEAAEVERERRRLAELEREKRMKEDYQRKLEEMKRKQAEEEERRRLEQIEREKEEEERRRQEEEMLAAMAEQEREEYEQRKREMEEERRRREEEERLRREEEARLALEEAKRLAEEMARKQLELEARLKFNRSLQLESTGFDHSHNINRAFVYSYYELIQWLGLDIPEFELLKLQQY